MDNRVCGLQRVKKIGLSGLLSLVALVGFSGCGNENPRDLSHEISRDADVLSHYIAIQERLANDSISGIGEQAERLGEKLSDSEAVAAARAISQADDIDVARRHFETVSIALLADLKEHGSSGATFYEAHCPMAFGNRGASWIQADATVNNPYYGSQMLRCGEIRGTFVPENGNAHHHEQSTAPGVEELPEGARMIEVKAHDFRFDPAEITVAPGEVFALRLENIGQVVHMWEIEGRPETHVHAEVGQTAQGVIIAPDEPGEYRIVCTEAGHTEAGMVGRLIVMADDAGR